VTRVTISRAMYTRIYDNKYNRKIYFVLIVFTGDAIQNVFEIRLKYVLKAMYTPNFAWNRLRSLERHRIA